MGDSTGATGFVQASRHRIAILVALQDWPRTTSQIADACCLSPAHACRALRELSDKGLVDVKTPGLQGKGKLYGLTLLGETLAGSVQWGGRRPVPTPMVRASQPRAWNKVLTARFGRRQARMAFVDAGWPSGMDVAANRWVPLRSLLKLIEAVERRFGDGSYAIVRDLSHETVAHVASIRRYVMRALPLAMLAEFAPAVYLREFNHGRMEVEASPGRAHFMQYDWLSSPGRCAAWLGNYEGLTTLKNSEAVVEKVECLLRGDEFCGYVAEWEE